MAISNVSESTKNAILRKSAQTLPNRPTEQGYTAEEIKRRFYQPVVDATFSALSEVDRVIDEVNVELKNNSDTIADFIESCKISENYKKTFTSADWTLDNTSGLYKFTIAKSQHKVDDYKEIKVTMYIINSSGEYQQVNQYTISTAGVVTAYSDELVSGVILIGINRDGYVVSSFVTDVNLIQGLADVAKTGNYNDLNNKPNFAQVTANETAIANIISGSQKVGNAQNADNATNATYASTSGYSNTAGTATSAAKANADEDGTNIKAHYAKSSGTYSNMSVGYATRANKDSNGDVIADTYLKKSDAAGNASVANRAITADSATKATNDGLNRNIANTYTTGLCITKETLTVQVRVGDKTDGSDSVDMFRDSGTSFQINAYMAKTIDNSHRYILFSSHMRQVNVSWNRHDDDYLFLYIEGLNISDYPSVVRVTSEEYSSGNKPNNADKTDTVVIGGKTFLRYNIFDEGYDYENGHYILLELLG